MFVNECYSLNLFISVFCVKGVGSKVLKKKSSVLPVNDERNHFLKDGLSSNLKELLLSILQIYTITINFRQVCIRN